MISTANLAPRKSLYALPQISLCALKSPEIVRGEGVLVMILLNLEATKAVSGSRYAAMSVSG